MGQKRILSGPPAVVARIGGTAPQPLRRPRRWITSFEAASFTAFLWPTDTGGFGGPIARGRISDIKADITKNEGFYYVPLGRMWITAYPPDTTGQKPEGPHCIGG